MNAPSPTPSHKPSSTPRLDDQQVGGEHYAKLAITPWQALEAWLTPEEFRGYLKGEAIVYIARELSKAGPVDIGKARHTLQKLEEVYPQVKDKLQEPPTAGANWAIHQAQAAAAALPRHPCIECVDKGCQRADACTAGHGTP